MIRQNNLLTVNLNDRVRFDSSNALGLLIEKIWQDVGCQVSRDRVKRLVLEESGQFCGFDSIKFASALVHRRVRVRLIEETM